MQHENKAEKKFRQSLWWKMISQNNSKMFSPIIFIKTGMPNFK